MGRRLPRNRVGLSGQARAHAELAALARLRGDEVAARRHRATAASLLGRGEDT
ncbi:hypothetical protein [Streptomyces sp. NPDC088719]|uniref:hypothetical protein n=1 Tax=Streptomyces sp. NPDC088719 TaxID=3365872 RepID=UPI0037F3CC3D